MREASAPVVLPELLLDMVFVMLWSVYVCSLFGLDVVMFRMLSCVSRCSEEKGGQEGMKD